MRLPPHQVRHRWLTPAPVAAVWSALEAWPAAAAPVEAVPPHWLHLAWQHEEGTLDELSARIGLEPVPEGTALTLDVRGVGRTVAAWPWSRGRTQARAAGLASELAARVEGLAPGEARSADPAARARLEARLVGVDPAVVGPLAELVERAPAWRLARLRPPLLARLWGLPEERVLAGLLAATRAGALQLSWELACPTHAGAPPDGPPPAEHCPRCRVRYDTGFAEACAVHFAPVPEVRATDSALARRLHPPRPPALLAEAALDPGQAVALALELAPGTYRVQCASLDRVAVLEVGEGLAETGEVALELTEYGVLPPRVHLAPGPIALALRSRLTRSAAVCVQARSFGPAVLPVPAFLTRVEARGLLPEEAVAPGPPSISRRGAVLALEWLRSTEPERLAEALEGLGPDRTYRGTGGTLALWWDPGRALVAAAALARHRALCAGLAVGVVVLRGEQGAIGGAAAAHARAAAQQAGAGRVLLAASAVEAPECAAHLAGQRLEAYGAYRVLPAGERAEPTPPADGARYGDYALGALLGEGGFGAVYAARDTRTGASAAVKILRADKALHAPSVERFHEECRLTALVSAEHPGMPRVLDWGFSEEGRLFLAMERLYGPMFAEEIADRAGVGAGRAAAVAAGVLDVLAAVHAHGLVHCDVKPSNVLIAHDRHTAASPYLAAGERVFLLDLGACSAIRERFPGTARLGTRAYMSPEQRAGAALDPRTDLYAVGVLVLHAIRGRGNGPVGEAARGLPAWLAPVVARAVAEAPEERWPDALAMRAALLDGLDGLAPG